MSKQTVDVVVDIFEPDQVEQRFRDHPDVDGVKLGQLEAADIIIGDVGFERKTWDDFASSMQDGRLEEQPEKLREFDRAYILIEETMAEAGGTWSNIRKESLLGKAGSLTARESGVHSVIPCSSRGMLVDTSVILARKHVEEPSTPYIPTGDVDDDEPAGKKMWGCASDVGPVLAGRLYEEYGPPSRFVVRFDPTEWEDGLTRVDGIGEEKAASIAGELW